MTKYYIPEATTFHEALLEEERENFIKNRFEHQMKVIEEAMRKNRRDARWFLAYESFDMESYKKKWLKEFDAEIRTQFEARGYNIYCTSSGNWIVEW